MSVARPPWWLPLAAWAGTGVIRLLAATWRFEIVDAPEYTAARAAGEPVIFAFWHAGLLPLAVHHRGEGIAVLVSRHRDGELITRVIERLGYVTARGSSTRGGEAGVREMLAWSAQGRSLGITPDGPRGPAEKVKDGLVYLSARSALRIVPLTVASRPVWALRSWDRFRVPKPFARVRIAHGAPLRLDISGADGLQRACARFEDVLGQLARDQREQVGEQL